MPKVFVYQDNKTTDITDYVSTIALSGSKTEVARKLSLAIVNSVIDYYTQDFYIKNGSMLKLVDDDNKVIFNGFVFLNERAGKASTVTVTAYDRLIYLLKSKAVYNFKNKTAEQIAQTICTHFKIEHGNLAATGIKQSFIANNKTLYDIIMQAYTGASKQNGKKYIPRMKDDKLDVIEIGSSTSQLVLEDSVNLTDSGYSESIENMVNRVKIYDDKGNIINNIENAEWIRKYGVLQGIYTKEKDKNANTVAKGS